MDSEDSGSEYEMCLQNSSFPGKLPFDPASLETFILKLADTFDFRIVLNEERSRNAIIVTTGLTIAGCMIGKHYGGKLGAALGGAVGGVCGIGIAVVSMRDIWEDIKSKLSELFDIVYDYLAGMGLDDYKAAAMFLTGEHGDLTQLALVLLQVISNTLDKEVLSSLNA